MGGFVNFTTRIAPESIVAGSVVDYSLATAYTTGQIVNYNGVLWTATANSTGQVPAAGSAYWGITNASQESPKGGAILNGTSQYFKGSISNMSYPYSMGAVFKTNSITSIQTVSSLNTSGSVNNLQALTTNVTGKLQISRRDGISTDDAPTTYQLEIGKLYLVNVNFIDATSYDVYVNGVLTFSTITATSRALSVDTFTSGLFRETSPVYYFNGTIYGHYLHNYALTQQDVTDRWNNGQPQDFVEPYLTANASQTELVTNGDFVSDVASWSADGTSVPTITWNAGGYADLANLLLNNDRISQAVTTIIGKKYKMQMTVSNFIAGTSNVNMRLGASSNIIQITADGTYTLEYTAVATSTSVYVAFTTASGTETTYSVDNASVKTSGETFSIKPNDWGTNGAKCIIGGEISVANSTASPIALSDGFDGHLITSATYTMATSIYRGQLLKYVKIKNIDTGAIVLSLGTTASGTDLINAVTIPASSEVVFSLLSHFSDIAETTLYFSNTGTSNYQVRFTKENV